MLMMLPGLQPEELLFLQGVMNELTDEQQKQFLTMYRGKRKELQTMTILTAIGFFGIAGIQRFLTGDIALGVIYLLTCGFCFIGTIIDLVNIKRLTNDYNQSQAIEAATMVKMMVR